jgi:hypothetical protein
VNIANTGALESLKDGYFRESEIHNALATLSQQTKEEAEVKINAQTAELDKMEANWKGKCKMAKMANVLSAGVAQLKKKNAKAGPIMHHEKSLGAKEGLPADQPDKAFVSVFNTMQNINNSEVVRAWVLSSSLTDKIIAGKDDDNKMSTKCEMTEALSTEIATKKQIPSAGPNKDQGEDDELLGPNQSDDSKDISIGRRKMVLLRKLLGPKRESQGTRESPSSINGGVCESVGYISSCTRSFESRIETQDEASSTPSRSKSCTKKAPDINQASLKQSKSVNTSDSTIESADRSEKLSSRIDQASLTHSKSVHASDSTTESAGTSEASSSRIDPYSSYSTFSTSESDSEQGERRDDDEEEDSRDESNSDNPMRMMLVQ